MLQRYTFLIDTKKNVPASERFTRKSVDFRERAAAVFRFGRRVCGRRSRTLSRGPGSCGAGRLRTARQRGGCGRRAHLPLSGTVAAGLPGSVECRRCVSTGSRNTSKEALLPEDGGRVDGDGCGGWRGAAAGCGAEAGTLITPLIPNESLRTACRVQSRVSMMIPLSSPGRTLFRSGEGFLCTVRESEPHRICWPQDR